MRVCLRHGSFHFRHRDHRQKTNKYEKERSKNSERADVCPDVHPSREKQTPRGREKVAMQSAYNDDEALEPHAGVHAHADEINDIDVAPAPLKPEKLRREYIAKEHANPPVPPVGTKNPVPKREPLVRISAVPGHEKFHHVGVTDE